MKNILHISDLHVSQIPTIGMVEYRLKQLLDSLLNDLDQFPEIDLILITGDITYSGVDEEYEIFDRHLLSPLLTKLNLDFSRVVITPGNHDLNRKDWKESELTVRDNLYSKIDQVRIEKIKQEIINDGVCKRLEAFNRFRDKVDELEQKIKILINPLFAVYEIDGIGIGCINSSWLAYESDREKLIIGEWQIKEILRKLKIYQQKILVLHHPLDWLHPDDRRVVSDLIHQSGVKCVFYGHMHDFSMLRESQFAENSILKMQAGKFDVSKDDGFGGYSIIKLLENNKFENGKVIFRKYGYKSEKFIPWTERSKNGEFDYSLEDSEPFNTAAFAEVCEELIKEIDYDLICNTGLPQDQQRKLSEIFVQPVLAIDDESLMTESYDANKQGDESNRVVTLKNIFLSSASYVILGAENSGKTSLAKRLLLNYLTEQSHENVNSIVYYLDIKKSNFNSVNQIKNQLISFYTEHDSARQLTSKLEKKLAGEGAVIVFDSLDLLDRNKIKLLKNFVIEHKSAKFVMFGQLPIKTAFVDLVSEVSTATEPTLKFNFLTIKNIQRSHVRDLFEKWSPNTNGENEKAIKYALSVINGAGMPSNPFVYTMLLSIAERKSTVQKSYMHEADLVENFIETILQKHVVNVSSDSPQYKDILLYLGFISDKMHISNCYARSKNELRADAHEFNKLISQNFDIEKYINPLIDSGVLKSEDDNYVFSQVCFFNYAYANWLSKKNINYDELDESLSFIRFDKVIEYLSALKKSDVEILECLFRKVDKAWSALLEIDGLSDLSDAESEISKSVEHDLIDLINHDHIETSLNGENQTKEEADQY
ncbi:MAG: metallophosphoesterase, partial [Oscillospiraceae bacterium]